MVSCSCPVDGLQTPRVLIYRVPGGVRSPEAALAGLKVSQSYLLDRSARWIMFRPTIPACVLPLAILVSLCPNLTAAAGDGSASASPRLPSPPVDVPAPPGWSVEHVAFALGNSGKAVGGPARWAVVRHSQRSGRADVHGAAGRAIVFLRPTPTRLDP